MKITESQLRKIIRDIVLENDQSHEKAVLNALETFERAGFDSMTIDFSNVDAELIVLLAKTIKKYLSGGKKILRGRPS